MRRAAVASAAGSVSSSSSTTRETTTVITPPTSTNHPSQQPHQPKQTPNPHPSASIQIATVKRRRYGTSPFDENWLNLDCCGLFCALLTYALHTYGVYAVDFVLIPPWMSTTTSNIDGDSTTTLRSLSLFGHLHRILFATVAFLACWSHFKAMTTDPGAVPPDAVPLPDPDSDAGATSESEILISPVQKGRRLCRRCKSFKPQRAHHCSVCRRCIIKMDHHCPWVNNCVGIGNHKYFLLFVFYTFLSCFYSMTLVVTRFVMCMHKHSRRVHCLDHPTDLLSILGLVIESMLFGLFTSCMMVDQWDVVMSNVTHIDRLKGETSGNGSGGNASMAGLVEVFGVGVYAKKRDRGSNMIQWDWLSPFAKVCFPSGLQDEILGYCRPCGRKASSSATTGAASTTSANVPSGDSIIELSSPGRIVRSVAEIV